MPLVRIISCLATALFALQVGAVSMVTRLDSHNVNNQRLNFTVKATKTGHNVRFQVSIESKEATLSPILQAHLTVFDGTNRIVSCAVERTRRDKGVTYEFEVSSKYLAESQFNFGNMADANGQPMPAGDYYWFYLKDFALDATTSSVESPAVSRTPAHVAQAAQRVSWGKVSRHEP